MSQKGKQQQKRQKNPLWKIIITDAAGVLCLLLVPILGPLPGPGGIPLLIAGFGLLAVNHDWADDAVHYVKQNSETLRHVVFPDKKWPKIAWDLFALLLFGIGLYMSFQLEGWFWRGISIGFMAGSTTVFMFNRDRIDWFDKLLRRSGRK